MFPDGIAASQALGGGLRSGRCQSSGGAGTAGDNVPADTSCLGMGGLGVFPALCHMPLDLQSVCRSWFVADLSVLQSAAWGTHLDSL